MSTVTDKTQESDGIKSVEPKKEDANKEEKKET